MIRHHRLRLLSAVAMGLFVAVVAGCSRDLAPTDSNQAMQPPILIREAPGLRTLSDPPPLSATKFLKASDGGEVQIHDIKVRFEKGSLPADVNVTLTLLDTQELSFRIEPAGLLLKGPALVKTDKLHETNGGARTGVQILRRVGDAWTPLTSNRDDNKIWSSINVLGDYSMGVASTDGNVELISWLSGESYRTRHVSAAKGGSVKFSRYELKIPAGALAQDTYITVRDPGNGYLMCDLGPEGLHFRTPITLEVDLKGTGVTGSEWSIFWWNPASNLWEDQHGVCSGEKVVAQLSHFSLYAPGKAGW
jgi:hypothetical protein